MRLYKNVEPYQGSKLFDYPDLFISKKLGYKQIFVLIFVANFERERNITIAQQQSTNTTDCYDNVSQVLGAKVFN